MSDVIVTSHMPGSHTLTVLPVLVPYEASTHAFYAYISLPRMSSIIIDDIGCFEMSSIIIDDICLYGLTTKITVILLNMVTLRG